MNPKEITISNATSNSNIINKKKWETPSLDLILKDEITNQPGVGKDGGGSGSSRS